MGTGESEGGQAAGSRLPVIVIRPEPGAAKSLEAALGLGLDAHAFPLFAVRTLPWEPVARDEVDALVLGSANALRHGGEALEDHRGLPAYVVGAATAKAASAAGLEVVATGQGGLQSVMPELDPAHRRLLRLTGPDTAEFLQGLVTNDVRRAPCWSALLTPQGKYLADFLIVPDGERLLIDVDEGLAGDLIRRLSMYKLRSDVALEPTDLQVTRGTGPAPDGAIADPRDPALGWRLYGAETGDDGSDWDAIRVAHTIPESLIELIPNETIILEAGFERLNGVDFRKGCYVGQEVTARMKHKTELRKGLARVRVTGEAGYGAEITADGKAAGTLFTRSGDRAIAYLRFDRMGEGMEADGVGVAAE